MDSQIFFNCLVGLCGTLGGWLLKVIWDAINELKKDVKDMNREMHEDFVRREDFKDSMIDMKMDMREGFKEVKDLIGVVFKKLDAKAEK
jgi:hypothetical protein